MLKKLKMSFNIKPNPEKGGGLFGKEGMPRILLNRCESAFREFIEKLKNMKPLMN